VLVCAQVICLSVGTLMYCEKCLNVSCVSTRAYLSMCVCLGMNVYDYKYDRLLAWV